MPASDNFKRGFGMGREATIYRNSGQDGPERREKSLVPYIAAVVMGLLMVAIDRLDGVSYLGDIDDVLRALQIKQLLATASWFDRTLPMISMPESYVSPWSRFVDLPYILITLALSPFMDADAAMHLAFQVWPPAMLVVYCILVVSILDALHPSAQKLSLLSVIATMMMMILPIWEFTPGRIDHHNMQLLLFMVLFRGIISWSPRGAIIAACASVVSVAVGLELLPLVILLLGAIASCWIMNRPFSGAFMLYFGAALIVVAPLAGLSVLGWRAMIATACDSYSAPYVSALSGYGLVTFCLAAFVHRTNWVARAAVMGSAGCALVAVLILFYPACLLGPYQMVDTLTRALWLDRVGQERSILLYFEEGKIGLLLMLSICAVILMLSWMSVAASWRDGRSAAMVVFLCALMSLLLVLVQTRFVRFPPAFASLFIPSALCVLAARPRLAGYRTGAFVIGLALLAFLVHQRNPHSVRTYDVIDYMTADLCRNADLSGLRSLEAGRIMTTAPLGLVMAKALPKGMSIAGISFHRAAPGMRRIYQALALEDKAMRRAAMEPFDYVVLCKYPIPSSIRSHVPFVVLSRGGAWPGLVALPDASRGNLMVFSVDHKALQ